MAPKATFRRVSIVYPPVPTRKWKPGKPRPHVADPHHRKPITRKPEFPHTEIEPHSTLEKSWHRYRMMSTQSAILFGHFAQSHPKFHIKYRGKQGPAICFMAIGYTKVKDMETWDEYSIDKIMDDGNLLYLYSVKINKRTCTCTTPKEVYPSFFIDSLNIVLGVDNGIIEGTMFRVDSDVPALRNVVKKYFRSRDYAIIEIETKFFAMWKLKGSYYLFDPNDRDEDGDSCKAGYGVAVVVKFSNCSALVQHIWDYCCTAEINSKFTLTPIHFKKLDNKVLIPPAEYISLMPKKIYKIRMKSCLGSKEPAKPLPQDMLRAKPVKSTPTIIPGMKKPLPQRKQLKGKPKKKKVEEPLPESNTPSLSSLVQPERIIDKPHLIPREKPKPPSVTFFDELDPSKYGILHASYHQCDPEFSKFKGRQELGNAVAAITMLRQHKSKLWFTKLLDEILLTGETIFLDSRKNVAGDQSLGLHTMNKKFKMNKLIYTADIDEFTVIGRLNSSKFEVLNLLQALEEFFSNHDRGIVRGPLCLAVWKEAEKYYMFDPNERDPTGRAILKAVTLGNKGEVAKEEAGTACLMWFFSLEDLVSIYMRNVNKYQRRELFIISKTEIKEYIEKSADWNNFISLRAGKWIIRGTISQNNPKYSGDSRNMQCTATATVAILFYKVVEISTWNRELLDEILDEGDVFYKKCIDELKAKKKFIDKMLMMNEMLETYTLKEKELFIIIEECIVNGLLNATENNDVPNLRNGITEFFQDNDAGVITARGLSVAVWKDKDAYYYFDSHARDAQGYTSYGGTACILRLTTLDDVARIMRANLGASNEDIYNIARVEVKLMERTADGLIKPEFKAYTELSVQKGILRCSTHQGNTELYDIYADKQTIPNLMVSFGMASLIPAGDWTRDDADEILLIGNSLYEQSRNEWIKKDLDDKLNWNAEENRRDLDDINLENVIKEFYVGVNKVVINIGEGNEGIFEVDIPYKKKKAEREAIMATTLRSMLYTALETITPDETKHETLIISPLISVAVWKEGVCYYLFDPKGKDQEGNFYGRELWSAKIIPMEGEEGEDEAGYVYEDFDDTEVADPEPKAVNVSLKPSAGEKDVKKATEDESVDGDAGKDEEEEEEEEEETGSTGLAAIDQTDAKACVLLFTTLDEITNHIIENVPPNKQCESFKMHQVKLTARPEVKLIANPQDRLQGNWFEYQEIDQNRWILRGTINIHYPLFPPVNRSKQYGAMGVIACCFARLYAQPRYKSSTVDLILKYGDKLHSTVLKEREKGMLEAGMALTDDEMKVILGEMIIRAPDTPREFYLGDYLVRFEVVAKVVEGDLAGTDEKLPEVVEEVAPPPPPPAPKGRQPAKVAVVVVEEPPPPVEAPAPIAEVLSLRKGLAVFFQTFNFGVLSAKHISVSVWKLFDIYYMFDPESRGPLGVYEVNGVACITRFVNIDQLASVFEKNLTKDGSNVFTIDQIVINSQEANRPQVEVKDIIPAEPKITAFQLICPGKMILRGTFHQDNPRFKVTSSATSCPNALVALGMTHIHKAMSWSKPIVDDILANGFNLYKTSVQDLGYEFNTWEDKLLLDLVNNEFTIGVMKVTCVLIVEDIKRGVLTIKDPEIINLRLALQYFFEDYRQGVIESDTLSTAVWYEEKLFYMFDPNARGSTGLYSTGGTACLLVFKSINYLADHYIANVPKSAHMQSFQITPVIISINEQKTPMPKPIKKTDILKVKELDSLADPEPKDKIPKKHVPDKSCNQKGVPKKLKPECCCPEKRKLVTQNPLVMPEVIPPDQKKNMARAVRDAKRLKEVALMDEKMRNEFFTYEKGQMILRAHFSQNSEKYNVCSRNKQTYCNALVAIVMTKIHDVKTWTYKNIEIILDSADVLYRDSYIKYRPENPLLGLKNINREFYIQHYKIITDIFRPVICGDLCFGELYLAFLNFFTQYVAGIISCDALSVAIFQKTGEYYMFEPHARNEVGEKCVEGQYGVACVLRFTNLEEMIEKYMRNTGVDRDAEEQPKWALSWVNIESVRRTN